MDELDFIDIIIFKLTLISTYMYFYFSKRKISKFESTVRRVCNTRSKMYLKPSSPVFGNNEMNTHADTCIFGKNFVVLHSTARECDVLPYANQYEPITGVQIVTAATAWTDSASGETIILVVNEGLWMPNDVDATLLNPNQLRYYGSTVQDNPFDGDMFIRDPEDQISIPMALSGTTIMFETRTPTDDELENCRHIILSFDHVWDPNSLHLKRNCSVGSIFENDKEVFDNDFSIFNSTSFNNRLSSIKQVLTDVCSTPSFRSQKRYLDVSVESLADKWLIGTKQAALTLKHTTQNFLRSATLPLSRRFKADRMFLRPRLQGEWYTDTVFGPVKSRAGNNCGQLFANESYYAVFYPMDSRSKAGDSLRLFCRNVGIPDFLRFDGAKEMCEKGCEFQRQVRKNDIRTHVSEAYRPNQSPAEGVVREIKKKWYRLMFKKRVPKVFWDYGMCWVCEIQQRTFLRSHRIDGGVPLQKVTGHTPDISNYLEFGFYDRVWYRDRPGCGSPLPGRWLGVAENVGSIMTYWILTISGNVIARSDVWCPTNLELQTDEIKATMKDFDDQMHRNIGEEQLVNDGEKPDPSYWSDLREKDDSFDEEFFKLYQDDDLPEEEDAEVTVESSPGIADDEFLKMELALPRDGDGPSLARVKRRKTDANGRPIGTANLNPILDTRLFEVEFLDGHTAAMTANAIAENLFAQVDEHGHRMQLMDEIIDHRCTGDAANKGKGENMKTTKGWELLVRWKDGSQSWVPLKDLKEAYMVQTADYAVQNKIQTEPAFAWWVPHVLRKRDIILCKVKSKYWQTTHKYGIEIPKNINHAKEIDRRNGNSLWWDAICQEMATVRVAFEAIDDGKIPPGYTKIDCHLIFDVKLGENFRRKARFVAGGHVTDVPSSLTYSSVVSRDSVRICLLLSALNGLDVMSCDIKGAYLTAPCKEKIVVTAGEEFGPELKGKLLRVTRALYGLKSAGASFRSYLADYLYSISYRPSYADPDVWMRPAVHPDGRKYYEYILAYVDDLLAISRDPRASLLQVREKFTLKNDRIDGVSEYLGASLTALSTATGEVCWCQSSDNYITAAIKTVEEKLKKRNLKLPSSKLCSVPMVVSYKPHSDSTCELKAEGHKFYQELIGMLRWAIELGRLDILYEVSTMSQYLACPREGHLEAVLRIFGYLKYNLKRKIAFDHRYPRIDERRFVKYDWEEFYRGAKEKIPMNAPPPRGEPVSTHCFVDASFANASKRRSQMGYLIFVNSAPIIWMSKRTNTVESSTFGAEIVALRNAVDAIEALRYKLRMLGVEVIGATDVFCDNEAVVKNCSTPESVLKKKHLAVNYHRNREAVAAGVIRIAYEHSATNLADVFTKNLPVVKRNGLLDRFMY